MSEKWPRLPTPEELFKFGLVQTALTSLGLVVTVIGVFRGVSLANPTLLLGLFLLLAGFTWHYGGKSVELHPHEDRSFINWSAAGAFAFFALLTLLVGLLLLKATPPTTP